MSHPTTAEGATLTEQLLDCSRRNNVDLLDSIFESLNHDPHKIAELINESKDPLGNTCLHLCCKYGSWEVLDKILDQEGGIEIDPQNNIDGDTPLHVAVRYSLTEPEHGTFICQNLIDCGADARIKNKAGEKPIDLVHGDDLDDLADLLQGAEIAADEGPNIAAENVDDDDDDGNDDEEDDDDDDDSDKSNKH
ncbi:ankyrin repeat-containing protein ANK1 SCDLUD_002266 [Saccharomycodes ludwigii]|uniref:ankyrin repeat-containing protein ANK1 n=1 Tax=Saccharomycodes ludwigii TaxID=36035 RepID=UPI001E8914A8|nr:hypothetical protein SCDLUD_002266 [Saccharomycodes ludwigii]KAH3900813.1 hypothetical protein SCDLUD_002266 [Saccharomycodes ludwigii]